MSRVNSPFKFLDSYQQADADVFFGREKETHDLYSALSGVKLLLVYGPSGSGKTSLIECGLRNQFSDADWYALSIRKGADINASVFAGINQVLKEKIELDTVTKMPADSQIEFGQAVEKLFSERFQPVYFLFDQFEELLISGNTDEKNTFFTLLNKLIRNKLPSRVLLIMREEFIGHLSEFESLCPSIFQHRFRVEKMGRTNVEEVIYNILEAPRYRDYFSVDDSRKLAESILLKLPDKRMEIELAHVQVFLGELWDRAQVTKIDNKMPVLDAGLIHDDDNLETILESFLRKQMTDLDNSYGNNVSLELLAAMITDKFTKLQLSETAIEDDLAHKKVVAKQSLANLLKDLEYRRIIRTLKAGDETQYEISHDLLALVVGQNLTEEMKMREKAGDIYKVYSERQGLFSQDDIDYLRPFEQNLSFPPGLQQRINESIYTIKKNREEELVKTRKRLRKLRGLLALMVIAFVVALYFGNRARRATKTANDAKVEAERSARVANDQKNIALNANRSALLSKIDADSARNRAIRSKDSADNAKAEALKQKGIADQNVTAARIAKEDALKQKEIADQSADSARKLNLKNAASEYARLIQDGPSDDNNNEKTFYAKDYFLAYSQYFDQLNDSLKNFHDKAAYGIYKSIRNKLYYDNELYQRIYDDFDINKSLDTVIKEDDRLKDIFSNIQNDPNVKSKNGKLNFSPNVDNYIYVYNDNHVAIDTIYMGARVTALDFNDDKNIIYFGTSSGYIGYIDYNGKRKKYQPVFENKLKSEITAIHFFDYKDNPDSINHFLLAVAKTSNSSVYKLDGKSLKPDRLLIGNELPYKKDYGNIEQAVFNKDKIIFKTSKGTYYSWNPFSHSLLPKLKVLRKFDSLDPTYNAPEIKFY